MLPLDRWRGTFDERMPIYLQIIDRFSQSLVRGELVPGERIPSIRDLALGLRVNTNTVQRAYQEMEREKKIYSQRGTGYFIVNDTAMVEKLKDDLVHAATQRFIEEMSALGFDRAQILSELEEQLTKEEKTNALTN